jgi:hypothetical protein
MILFSSKKLEKYLSQGILNSWEKTKYLVFLIILSSLTGPIYLVSPRYENQLPKLNILILVITWFLFLIITFRGIKKCFKTNQGIDDHNFIIRFIILFVPVMVKFMLIFFISSLVFGWLISFDAKAHPTLVNRSGILILVAKPILAYLFFLVLNGSFIRLGVCIYPTKSGDKISS